MKLVLLPALLLLLNADQNLTNVTTSDSEQQASPLSVPGQVDAQEGVSDATVPVQEYSSEQSNTTTKENAQETKGEFSLASSNEQFYNEIFDSENFSINAMNESEQLTQDPAPESTLAKDGEVHSRVQESAIVSNDLNETEAQDMKVNTDMDQAQSRTQQSDSTVQNQTHEQGNLKAEPSGQDVQKAQVDQQGQVQKYQKQEGDGNVTGTLDKPQQQAGSQAAEKVEDPQQAASFTMDMEQTVLPGRETQQPVKEKPEQKAASEMQDTQEDKAAQDRQYETKKPVVEHDPTGLRQKEMMDKYKNVRYRLRTFKRNKFSDQDDDQDYKDYLLKQKGRRPRKKFDLDQQKASDAQGTPTTAMQDQQQNDQQQEQKQQQQATQNLDNIPISDSGIVEKLYQAHRKKPEPSSFKQIQHEVSPGSVSPYSYQDTSNSQSDYSRLTMVVGVTALLFILLIYTLFFKKRAYRKKSDEKLTFTKTVALEERKAISRNIDY